MSEDNKSEKSSKDSIMDNDARNCIFNQFKSPSQNSNGDDEQFIMEGAPHQKAKQKMKKMTQKMKVIWI